MEFGNKLRNVYNRILGRFPVDQKQSKNTKDNSSHLDKVLHKGVHHEFDQNFYDSLRHKINKIKNNSPSIDKVLHKDFQQEFDQDNNNLLQNIHKVLYKHIKTGVQNRQELPQPIVDLGQAIISGDIFRDIGSFLTDNQVHKLKR